MRAPRIAAATIVVGVVGLSAATAAALLARLGWPFELFSHFRVQYFAAAVVLAVGAMVLRKRRVAAIAVAVCLLNSLKLDGLGAVHAAAADTDCQGPQITFVTANLYFRNGEHERVLGWLKTHPADVVVLEEVTAAWARGLARLPGYPYR